MDTRSNHLVILFLLISSTTILFNASFASENENADPNSSAKNDTLTAKALLIRYWNTHISNNLPKPSFLLSKASPLTAAESAYLTKLAGQNALSSHLRFFCSAAKLFCMFEKIPAKLDKDTKSNRRLDMEFTKYNMSFSAYDVNRNNHGTSFTNYSDETNFGVGIFKDYSKESGSENGTEPGDDSIGPNARNPNAVQKLNSVDMNDEEKTAFKSYQKDHTFKDYNNKTKFSKYADPSTTKPQTSQRKVSSLVRPWVEPGRFFRESTLKEGNVMVIPDIKDKTPKRSFLPRSVVSKLPFSNYSISKVKQIFNAPNKSAMERVIINALSECESEPNRGEIKRCVGSIEDMIDFATSILGHNVVVRTTENTKGAKTNVTIGSVKGINGGKITKAVSCHQSLYPYLLYYCHSVPKVKVYEADILDVGSNAKINHGVAICHLDTSAWSPRHGAFLALGPGPGKIEVCHLIFENDMIWTLADH